MLNERNTLLEDDGIEEEILVEEECSVAQAVWGDIQGNIENQTDLQNALDAKQDSLTEAQLNAVNSGITAEKVTTYDGYADQIARKADQSALNAETIARGEADTALGTRIDNEALARQSADNGLQTQIDAITSKSDVVDVVANYAALQAYDTSTLGNNDVVKVLDDETHEDALTYYRWSTTTQTWTYIGQEAPYYSKGQMDVKLAEKQDKLTAGANIQIQNGTISATDTTYTAGNGLNLNGTEFSADTTVLATKSDLDNYYTKPETDNLLAPKLEAEVVAELPTTGAEGKLYLTPKAHTTQTATGNPIEATVTEQAGQLESFQLYGDTFQQTYTGKNLFNKDSANVLVAYIDAVVSTITVNSQNRLIWIPCEPNTTYTVSRQRTSGGQKQLAYTTQEPAAGVQVYGKVNWVADSTECSITTGEDARYLVVRIWQAVQESDISLDNLLKLVQIEKSSSATAYEPYTGGQPSPNPDYPQQIQTVTGEQTVEIHGKNLLRYPYTGGTVGTGLTWTVADDGTIHVVGTIGGGNKSYYLYNRSRSDFDMPEIPAGTYKVFWSIAGSGSSPRITIQDANGYHNSNASNEVTIATSAKPTNIYIQFTGSQSGDVDLYIKPMIVPSDQANTYAPYSHQTLPLNLGSIELCKLGTYQDYIYKDGDEWKVHKEITKYVCDSTPNWIWDASVPRLSAYSLTLGLHVIGPSNADTAVIGKSNKFVANSFNYVYTQKNNGFAYSQSGFISCVDKEWGSESEAKADILGSIFYFVLQDAYTTDITITDANLIAQLEAIRTASLQNGTNTITNTATGTNLAGDMEVGYYGYNPRNRYDKFIWLELNNNYEQIGGE